MRLSTLLPLTILALATAAPLPSSSQENTLELRDPAFAIIEPTTTRSPPTADSNLNTAPVANKRCVWCHIKPYFEYDPADVPAEASSFDIIKKRGLNSPNAHRDLVSSRSDSIDDMALMDNSLNDVFILKKRGFWNRLTT